MSVGRSVLGSYGAVHLQLNNPSRRNALNHVMIRMLHQELQLTVDSSSPFVVVSGGSEGIFCAGGDVRTLVERIMEDRMRGIQEALEFFRVEFELISRVEKLAIPLISLWDGLVFGGGVGVTLPGRYRVVTERTRFAMPECGIGFFVDVGVTHALSRLKHPFVGTYLALTGEVIGPLDALWLGLGTHYIPSHDIPQLLDSLRKVSSADQADEILRHSCRVPLSEGASSLRQNVSLLQDCFSETTVPAIMSKLEKAAASSAFASRTLQTLSKKSPTSLVVTLNALKQAATAPSLDATLARDLELCRRFVEFRDFVEGIRCTLINKGQKPEWSAVPLDVEGWCGGTGVTPFTPCSDKLPLLHGVHRQIYNIWQDLEGHACFGCAPSSNSGDSLALPFFVPIVPCKDYDVTCDHFVTISGFKGVAHGGLIALLIDESAYFAFSNSHQIIGMTSALSIKYIRPLLARQWCRAEAKVAFHKEGKVTIEARISQKGKVCASGTVDYLILPLEKGSAVLQMDPSKLRQIMSAL